MFRMGIVICELDNGISGGDSLVMGRNMGELWFGLVGG